MTSEEQCEKWIAESCRLAEIEGIPVSAATRIWMRAAWHSSRSVLCVELPEEHWGNQSEWSTIRKCRAAIESAGIRTNG
jgi:hypothetical protein